VTDTAALVLAQVARSLASVAFSGRSADDALEQASAPGSTRPAIRAITLGSLRWYWRLDAVATVLLGATSLVPTLRTLLIAALHQLEYSRNPPEVTVSSAVDAVRVLRQPRATGLMNALLRRFLRTRDRLMARVLEDAAAASAHPPWLFAAMREAWPDHWQAIIDSNNSHPPLTLRANLLRGTADDYLGQLRLQGLAAHRPDWSPTALMLDQPVAVSALPGFAQGSASVQDAGAQLASALLGACAGERVLDACAAPGGKTCAILESAPRIALTAVDIDEARVRRIAENLERLQLNATLIRADLRESLNWWDAQRFDRILVDAPCSGTGVIRRHPDIKLLRRESDIPALVTSQRRILEGCLSMLRAGGRLLYSTCSLMPAENEQLVHSVLAAHPHVQVVPMPTDVALPPQSISRSIGVQLLPGSSALTDGFYYACLTVT
jgi:16S rRNA (cytosine967-C5)-methyltransferase